MPKTGVHWFRHGLRLHDNPALFACMDEVEQFIPIFIFDGKTAGTEICGFVRWRFLIQSLEDLERQFATFRIPFMCFYGQPDDIIEQLIVDWNVNILSFEKDSEAIWNERDKRVRAVCKKHAVQVIESASHTLYNPEDIFKSNNDRLPNTCEAFRARCLSIGMPDEPIPVPDLNFLSANFLNIRHLYDPIKHKVPNLSRFKVEPECREQEVYIFEGGESKALELWKLRLENECESFRKGRVNPNISKPVLFTKEISLSPYLRFGCLSVRKFFWDLKKLFDKEFKGSKKKQCPTEQLFWREYFYQLSHKNERFAHVDRNPMSFKIPWEWDCIERLNLLKKWEKGKTGFPWIDACMKQLIQEGWIHHACRNSLAVFLTRGALFLSWELGLKTFFHHLVDADWSVCSGNWNWISSGDPEEITDSLNIFCPVSYGKKIDPEGLYIKKYCPELKYFPLEYLYTPWKAPLNVQEEAECIIGRDYPEPILDHEKVYKENVLKLQQFFNTTKKDVFNKFLNNNDYSNVLKPTNFNEYKYYTYTQFLLGCNDFDDDF